MIYECCQYCNHPKSNNLKIEVFWDINYHLHLLFLWYNRGKSMNKNKLIFYSLILVASFLFLAFGGCGVKVMTYTPVTNANGEKYSSFVATGVPLFSFEYPVDYVITSYQPMPEFPGTSLMLGTLASIPPTTTMTDQISSDLILNSIDIYINDYLDDDVPTAEAAVDNIAVEYAQYEKEGGVKDFKIIYKRQVVVGGVKGWEIKYSFINYPRIFFGRDYNHPTPLIDRQVYFDYKDMSFNIGLFSDASIIDKTEKAYEHILQTFKLLE
jgi:hypothetical protein